MSESASPAPDLFDELTLNQQVGQVGAIAPMIPTRRMEEPDWHVPLRWWPAGIALAVAAAVGFVFRFPLWALAAQALVLGAMNLWPLPPPAKRAFAIVAASFFFAQVTSIFITPFTWPLRFGFCAVLLIGLTLVRVNESE
jgi:hypothetical protein